MTIEQIARYLMGSGAGVLAFWILEQIPQFSILTKKQKRFVSLAATAILGAFGGLILVGVGAHPNPLDIVGWVTLIVESGAAAVIAGHTAHGLTLKE